MNAVFKKILEFWERENKKEDKRTRLNNNQEPWKREDELSQKKLTPEEQRELAKRLGAILLLHLNIEKDKTNGLDKGTLDEKAVIDALMKGSAHRGLPVKDVSIILANTIEKGKDKYPKEMKDWAIRILKEDGRNGGKEIIVESSNPLGIEALMKLMEKKEKEAAQSKVELNRFEREIPQEQEQHTGIKEDNSTADIIEVSKMVSQIQGANIAADGRSAINGAATTFEQKIGLETLQSGKTAIQDAMTAANEPSKLNKNKAQGNTDKKYVTFIPNDKKHKPITGIYAGEGKDKNGKQTVIIRCGGKQIPAYPDKGKFVDVTLRHNKELRSIQNELKTALKEIKKDKGTGLPVHFARSRGTFEGPILAKTSTFAIQEVERFKKSSLVLHLLSHITDGVKETDEKIQEGKFLTITKSNRGIAIESKAQEEKERERNEKQRFRQEKQIASRGR